MRIVVISLPTALQRRRRAGLELAGAGLRFEFFDAFGAGGVDSGVGRFDGIDLARFRLNSLRDPLPGEIGCFASHRAVWQACARGTEPFVVLEDDFELRPGFRRTLRQLGTEIGWLGYVRLDAVARRRRKLAATAWPLSTPTGYRCLYVRDAPLRATAYVLHPAAAARLVKASIVFDAAVDKFLQRVWQHGCPAFAVARPVVSVGAIGDVSTIGPRPPKRRSPALHLRRLGYKLAGEWRRHRFNRRQLAALQAAPALSD